MTGAPLLYAVALLAWGAAGYRLPALYRRQHDPVARYFWLTLFFLALALTLLLAPIYLAIDRTAGVPNLARLLSNGCAMACSWSAQALLAHLTSPPEHAARQCRVLAGVLAVALLVMAVCFAAAPLPDEAADFTARYARTPFIFEYRLVFLAFLSLGMANAARLFWRYASLARRPLLRLGLRLQATAAGIGLGYTANDAVRMAADRWGLPNPIPAPGLVAQTLVAALIVTGVLGATLPAWGRRAKLEAAVARVREYRSLARLYPLWRALVLAHPAIALDPPASRLADLLHCRHLTFRLYRRVVEIRDGWLLLRPYADQRVPAAAATACREAGLLPAAAQTVASAAELVVALRRHDAGEPPQSALTLPLPPGGGDLETEVAMLEPIARCFTRSALVRAVAAQVLDRDPDGAAAEGSL